MNLEILIFCGGKCGGTTLSKTLDLNGYNILHKHGFNCYGLYRNKFRNEFEMNYNNNFEDYIKNFKDDLIIIVSYRTPIERKISSFFQNISVNCPNYKSMEIS